jgi:hypothetical protein
VGKETAVDDSTEAFLYGMARHGDDVTNTYDSKGDIYLSLCDCAPLTKKAVITRGVR